jgi:carbon storage regulator CsrA
MLVLSRKLEERIQIGENITITVLKIRGNSVQIGIEAPRSVSVVRAELPARRPEQESESDSTAAPAKTNRIAPEIVSPKLEPRRQAQRVAQQRSQSVGPQHAGPLHVGSQRLESWNPGERKPAAGTSPSAGTSPLAEHVHARRAPSVCTATLTG